MTAISKAPNKLIDEKSPYLLQHAHNPVNWYPWGDEAFETARAEDKPIFLSIGYSTCHWCHVMAHESFEDEAVAEILNRYFIAVKVDKEERPDLDAVYMNVCVSLTGSGGWPTTIIMDSAAKPFFAGTYFPKRGRYGMPGLIELLTAISANWQSNRQRLLGSADKIISYLEARKSLSQKPADGGALVNLGIGYFKSMFDGRYGGFGAAPKFPSAHNILFLLAAYEGLHDRSCLDMSEKTLRSMANGGIFDQIGFGFSRYSTDEKWLVPHFEKMLYDNALLVMAYARAYELTQSPVYKNIAEKTIYYIKREMTNPEGGFYSAQDADSDGVEGKYYVLTPDEIFSVLGEADGGPRENELSANDFCGLYDITERGNFDGKNIPNLIKNLNNDGDSEISFSFPELSLSKLYEYRRARSALRRDDKILTSWNSLMIAALADASVIFGDKAYIAAAKRSAEFIEKNLCDGEKIYTSFRDGKRSGGEILDDYAFYIYALLRLYEADPRPQFLETAKLMTEKTIAGFFDDTAGGFYLTGSGAEKLIFRPKESIDGAIPSGNSVMSVNLLTLNLLTGEFGDILDKQFDYMSAEAANAPGGHAFFLYALIKRSFAKRSASDYVCDENGCRRGNPSPPLRGGT